MNRPLLQADVQKFMVGYEMLAEAQPTSLPKTLPAVFETVSCTPFTLEP